MKSFWAFAGSVAISFVLLLVFSAKILPEILDDGILLMGILLVISSILLIIFRKKINKEAEEHNAKLMNDFSKYKRVTKLQIIVYLATGITIILFRLVL